jgi:hypothetical protein
MPASLLTVVLASDFCKPLWDPGILLLLGSWVLPTAALNLVYCRLCEGTRIRWRLLLPAAVILLCVGIGFFDRFVSTWGFPFHDYEVPLHLGLFYVAVGFNLVLCRFCKGIQTDWPIVLLVAGGLVFLGILFLNAFDAAISSVWARVHPSVPLPCLLSRSEWRQ